MEYALQSGGGHVEHVTLLNLLFGNCNQYSLCVGPIVNFLTNMLLRLPYFGPPCIIYRKLKTLGILLGELNS